MLSTRRGFIAWLSLAGLLGTLLAPTAASADTFDTWTGGPGAILDNTYDGFIDSPSANATVSGSGFVVSGWFVDRTAQGWSGADDVQVFEGTMDGGGRMLARGITAQNRPDVAAALGNPYWAASGFVAQVPSGALQPGQHTLSVYVHTGGKGWWYKQVQVNVSASAPAAAAPAPSTSSGTSTPVSSGAALPIIVVEKPENGENVPTKEDYEIIGYALDPNAQPSQGVQGTGIDRVELYLDAERDAGGTFLGNATLAYGSETARAKYGPQFDSAGWRLTFKPTNFHANTHLIYAYVHSAVSGKEDFVIRYFAITEKR